MKFFHQIFLAITLMSNGPRFFFAMGRSGGGAAEVVCLALGLPLGGKILLASPLSIMIFTQAWLPLSQVLASGAPPRLKLGSACILAARPANTWSTLKRKPTTS